MSLLEVTDLRVSFTTEEGVVKAVDGISFEIDRGEVVAIVGESGSGKSVTAMTLLGLTRSPNTTFKGSARYDGQELLTATEHELESIRGAEIAMVFQDPMSSLDPVYRVGDQIAEQILAHEPGTSKRQARLRHLEQVAPLVVDLALEACVLVAREAEQRHRGDGLAGAGLADDRHHLAAVDLEADAVDGLHDALLGGEGDAQVGDLQHAHRRMRGSRNA